VYSWLCASRANRGDLPGRSLVRCSCSHPGVHAFARLPKLVHAQDMCGKELHTVGYQPTKWCPALSVAYLYCTTRILKPTNSGRRLVVPPGLYKLNTFPVFPTSSTFFANSSTSSPHPANIDSSVCHSLAFSGRAEQTSLNVRPATRRVCQRRWWARSRSICPSARRRCGRGRGVRCPTLRLTLDTPTRLVTFLTAFAP
jgi:hypothetical protein